MKEKNLLLLRGLPGAGKSSFAKFLNSTGDFLICSLDEFFTDASGIYTFDYKQNHLAYKYCQSKTEEAMQKEYPKILVDQTFALQWELDPYLELAPRYDYKVFVITIENRHSGENIHGTTDEQLIKMAKNFHIELLPKRLREK